jgi:2-polyprenyl-3-methyl-5-hydroxy-6-metoxy-1,4-benzoquinol methylase
VSSVAYTDWHTRPGYFRDITQHFPREASILDVGCGSAWLGDEFAHYLGIDADPQAIDRAQRAGHTVQLADLSQPLEFESGSFDGVVMKDVLEHLGDPVSVVREAHRVLKPGGRIFASSPDAQRWVWDDYTHRRPYTRKAFRHLFADQGFAVERVGYESVAPGTSVISGYTRRKRRPRLLALLAWLPLTRRNVWLTAAKPR